MTPPFTAGFTRAHWLRNAFRAFWTLKRLDQRKENRKELGLYSMRAGPCPQAGTIIPNHPIFRVSVFQKAVWHRSATPEELADVVQQSSQNDSTKLPTVYHESPLVPPIPVNTPIKPAKVQVVKGPAEEEGSTEMTV